jgi:hypothetical protein
MRARYRSRLCGRWARSPCAHSVAGTKRWPGPGAPLLPGSGARWAPPPLPRVALLGHCRAAPSHVLARWLCRPCRAVCMFPPCDGPLLVRLPRCNLRVPRYRHVEGVDLGPQCRLDVPPPRLLPFSAGCPAARYRVRLPAARRAVSARLLPHSLPHCSYWLAPSFCHRVRAVVHCCR